VVDAKDFFLRFIKEHVGAIDIIGNPPEFAFHCLSQDYFAQIVQQPGSADLLGVIEFDVRGNNRTSPRTGDRMFPEPRQRVFHHIEHGRTEHQALDRIEAQ
jgi:hypothetical protein